MLKIFNINKLLQIGIYMLKLLHSGHNTVTGSYHNLLASRYTSRLHELLKEILVVGVETAFVTKERYIYLSPILSLD